MKRTVVIDNFSGNLTRQLYGKMDSGLAVYGKSYGYNPFMFPGSLTWLPDFSDITGAMSGVPLDGKTRVESSVLYLYLITDSGVLYKVNTSDDTFVSLNSTWTGSPTWNFGGSLEFFNGKIWITNDKGLSSINFDGTGEAQVGTWDSSHFIQSTYHPLKDFAGKMYVGNTTDGSSTNIGEIDSTNTIINYNRLSPALPTGSYVKDMDLTPDFSYLTMSVSAIPPENISGYGAIVNRYAGDSSQFRWNGTDAGVTAGITTPNFNITSLNFFGESAISFMYDWFGASVYDGARKILTSYLAKSPIPNASAATGNMIMWAAPSKTSSLAAQSTRGSYGLYAYGAFDQDQPPGFYQLLLFLPTTASFQQVTQMPFLAFVNNHMFQPQAATNATFSNKLYFSAKLIDGFSVVTNKFLSFTVSANPFLGGVGYTNLSLVPATSTAYTTQVENFQKKVTVSQIRVYTDYVQTGNGFRVTMVGGIGSTGSSNSVPFTDGSGGIDGGTFTWTQGTSPDPIQNRINFTPDITPTYSLGVQIQNTGTTNMVFRKIELDITDEGK